MKNDSADVIYWVLNYIDSPWKYRIISKKINRSCKFMEAGICQILRGTDGVTDSTAWSRNCQVNSKSMPTKSSLTYAFEKSKLKLNADFFQRPQYANCTQGISAFCTLIKRMQTMGPSRQSQPRHFAY